MSKKTASFIKPSKWAAYTCHNIDRTEEQKTKVGSGKR
jgi:hypothetical protein